MVFDELIRGKHLLNPFDENVMIFAVKEGEHFQKGDLAIVDPKTHVACHANNQENHEIIGRVKYDLFDQNGKQKIICVDGMLLLENTNDPDFSIKEFNVDQICYLEDEKTVTMDTSKNIIAGKIIGILDERIWISTAFGGEEE